MFHERRAAAWQEHVLVPLRGIEPYAGEVPDYRDSLLAAVQRKKQQLADRQDEWAARSLELLAQLEKEYQASAGS